MSNPARMKLFGPALAKTTHDAPEILTAPVATAATPLVEVELHLLASMLQDATAISDLPVLQAHDFIGETHYDTFAAIVGHAEATETPATALMIAAELEAAGKSYDVVLSLKNVDATPEQARDYAKAILADSHRRQKAAASLAFSKDTSNPKLAAELDRARELTLEVKTFLTSDDATEELLGCLQRRANGEAPPVATGFRDLDSILGGGFRGGQVIVLAARPGEGKSVLAQAIAEHMACGDGSKTAVFVSLEMLTHELMGRRLTSLSHGLIDRDSVNSGNLSDEQFAELERLNPILRKSKMEFLATPAADIDEIVSAVNARAKKGDVGLLVLDYLQLIGCNASGSGSSREQQIATASRRIKQLALKLQIPVLLLSQLNRSIETSKDRRRPKKSDLRESGSIEQDADVILFIHNSTPELHKSASINQVRTIIVAKQRSGPQDVDVDVIWLPEQVRFADSDYAPVPKVSRATLPKLAPKKAPKATRFPISEEVENFTRVLQIAAVNRGELDGIPESIIREVEACNAAARHSIKNSPFADL